MSNHFLSSLRCSNGFTSLYSNQSFFSLNFAAGFSDFKNGVWTLKACLFFSTIPASLVKDIPSPLSTNPALPLSLDPNSHNDTTKRKEI